VTLERYRLLLGRRREERELRLRFTRLVASGLVPVADEPLDLRAPEKVDLATGRLFDRRRRARRR
jgi:hypothetical protein